VGVAHVQNPGGARAAWPVALLLVGVLVVGCGSGSDARTPSSRPSLEPGLLGAARQLVSTLQKDVLLSVYGGANVATARRAVLNSSDLYAMVLAYTDFGGCGKVVKSFGQPGPAARPAIAAIGSACTQLERAAAIFRRAMKSNSPQVLVAATRASLAAEPLLLRAKAALASYAAAPPDTDTSSRSR
jgi:hypothetical protein